MNRQPIASTNISSAGYDEETTTMEVEFLQGGLVYQYKGVPKSVWEAFLNGNTPGEYFYHYIRLQYPFLQVG